MEDRLVSEPGRILRFIAADGQIEGAEWSQLHQILSHSVEAEIPFNTVHSNYPSVEKKKNGEKAKWLKLIGPSGSFSDVNQKLIQMEI